MLRACFAFVLVTLAIEAASAQTYTIALQVQGQPVEGMPLSWSDQHVLLLARDGRLWSFEPQKAADFRKLGDGFRGYDASQMRGRLLQELGRGFEVSATGHYVVAHPAGERSLWPQRFEEIYRSFKHYFTARGMSLKEPEFPLTAIVLKDAADFSRHASAEEISLTPGTLGYYSPVSNRVVLYDQTPQGANWSENADTIIHEATHQTAFNTGVHSRYAATPKWAAEGLAVMFEAPGVWDCLRRTRQADRIHRARLASFRRYASSRRRTGALAEIVSSDRVFQSDPEGAYAESWAITFYLAETQSAAWTRYLAKVAAAPAFQERTSQARLADFRSEFGEQLGLIEARMLRFVETLP